MLTGTPGSSVGQDSSKHPLLRRWDQTKGDSTEGGLQLSTDNAALITESVWFNIENGIQIYFKPSDFIGRPNQYRTSDYWMIPARTATGNIEWPTTTQNNQQVPDALPPDGVTHYYAPLAIIQDGKPSSCLVQFDPLTKVKQG